VIHAQPLANHPRTYETDHLVAGPLPRTDDSIVWPGMEVVLATQGFVAPGGSETYILTVEVGEEAVVGAGAVVTRDVAPRTVVIGSPARPIRAVRPDELLHD
jgi:acetyltransferase-like isoleucine patch superfamily enzyme